MKREILIQGFQKALLEDLNTPRALGALFGPCVANWFDTVATQLTTRDHLEQTAKERLKKIETLIGELQQVGEESAKELKRMKDHLDWAWSIMANVSGGDWGNQTLEWSQAANKWEQTVIGANRQLTKTAVYHISGLDDLTNPVPNREHCWHVSHDQLSVLSSDYLCCYCGVHTLASHKHPPGHGKFAPWTILGPLPKTECPKR